MHTHTELKTEIQPWKKKKTVRRPEKKEGRNWSSENDISCLHSTCTRAGFLPPDLKHKNGSPGPNIYKALGLTPNTEKNTRESRNPSHKQATYIRVFAWHFNECRQCPRISCVNILPNTPLKSASRQSHFLPPDRWVLTWPCIWLSRAFERSLVPHCK